MVDAWVQVAMFSVVLVAGLVWVRGTLRRWSEYSFAEDLRASFLRLRWSYSADLREGGPRLIAPATIAAAGLAGLVWVLVRRLSE